MYRVGLTMLLAVLVGCASLSPEGAAIKIVDPVELAIVKKECKQIGQVLGEDLVIGSAAGALLDMLNKGGAMGVNIIVSKMKDEETNSIMGKAHYVSGLGFKCPEAAKAKLTNAGAL